MKNKSILQQTKECYLCRLKAEKSGYFGQLPSTGLHRHHFMHGTANRKLAEKYGLYAMYASGFIMSMVKNHRTAIRQWT